MIPVKVQKISYYHPNRSYAVILKELSGERRLPVVLTRRKPLQWPWNTWKLPGP